MLICAEEEEPEEEEEMEDQVAELGHTFCEFCSLNLKYIFINPEINTVLFLKANNSLDFGIGKHCYN